MNKTKHIYFNCQSVSEGENVCKFTALRSIPILSEGDKWKFSIVRASVDGLLIPCWIPKMTYNNANPNLTSYAVSVKLVKTGDTHYNTENMIFANRKGLSAPTSVPQDQNSVVQNEYYWTYDINEFIEMFNNMMISCWENLGVAYNGSHTGLSTSPPKIQINGDKYSLYLDTIGFTNSGVAGSSGEEFIISFNDDLYNLLRTFDFIYDTSDNNLFNNQISLKNVLNSSSYGAIDYMVLNQSYSCLSIWSPVETMVFLSSTGDYREDMTGDVNLLGSSALVQFSDTLESQITDIDLDISNNMDWSNMVLYNPTASYRWIDIMNNQNIRKVIIQLRWKDRYGNFHDVILRDGGSLNVKLLFTSE